MAATRSKKITEEQSYEDAVVSHYLHNPGDAQTYKKEAAQIMKLRPDFLPAADVPFKPAKKKCI